MLKATANWLAQVDYDIATAEQMLHAGRYIYVIFMSHMALEKALKALVTEETQKLPPRTHNLIDLAQRAHVVLSQEQQDFLGKLNNSPPYTFFLLNGDMELNRNRQLLV